MFFSTDDTSRIGPGNIILSTGDFGACFSSCSTSGASSSFLSLSKFKASST